MNNKILNLHYTIHPKLNLYLLFRKRSIEVDRVARDGQNVAIFAVRYGRSNITLCHVVYATLGITIMKELARKRIES
jgi:hypothetical protein